MAREVMTIRCIAFSHIFHRCSFVHVCFNYTPVTVCLCRAELKGCLLTYLLTLRDWKGRTKGRFRRWGRRKGNSAPLSGQTYASVCNV